MSCRVRPLTVLFLLSGFIMLVSHRYFLVDSPARVIVAPRRNNFHTRHTNFAHPATQVSTESEDEDAALKFLAFAVALRVGVEFFFYQLGFGKSESVRFASDADRRVKG